MVREASGRPFFSMSLSLSIFLVTKGKNMASYRLEDDDVVSSSKQARKRRLHERLLILAHVKM